MTVSAKLLCTDSVLHHADVVGWVAASDTVRVSIEWLPLAGLCWLVVTECRMLLCGTSNHCFVTSCAIVYCIGLPCHCWVIARLALLFVVVLISAACIAHCLLLPIVFDRTEHYTPLMLTLTTTVQAVTHSKASAKQCVIAIAPSIALHARNRSHPQAAMKEQKR